MNSTVSKSAGSVLYTCPNEYIRGLSDALEDICTSQLSIAVENIVSTLEGGNNVYIAGNGGSAATASHMAADLTNAVYFEEHITGKILNLAESVPIITAIANDYGYEHIFSRQLESALSKDVLLVFSVSGNSKNLQYAVNEAKRKGMSIVSLTAQESYVSNNADFPVIAGKKDYGLSEDIQSAFLHIVKRQIQKSASRISA